MKTNSFLNRALSLLLTVVLLMSMVTVPAHATTTASSTYGDEDNLAWTLDSSGTLTISGTGAMPSGSPWDEYKDYITDVVIEPGVTSISDFAFYYYDYLLSVTIPDGLTSIGDYAFSSCSHLRKVELPDSVTSIGSYAFQGCSALRSINLHDGITYLGQQVFLGCNALKSIHIPSSIKEITAYMFHGCSSITTVDLPDGLTSIGEYAFTNSGLTSIDIPASVTKIGSGAFFGTGLTSVTLPAGITRIPNGLFSASQLTEIKFLGDIEFIGEGAFSACPFETFEIPETVEYIGARAFSDCYNLLEITVPEGITDIYEYTFGNCVRIESIVLPSTLTDIWSNAFDYCHTLDAITIPAGVEYIDNNVFAVCDCLNEVFFAGDAPVFEDNAFGGMQLDADVYVKVTAYYPYGNATWTADVMQDYGGDVTWKPFCMDAPHDYVASGTREPTCTEQGGTVYTCSKCGHTKVENSAGYGDHTGEWTTVSAPGCESTGLEYTTCTVCGQYAEREIPALGHSYTGIPTAPTCWEQGYTTYTCSNCGDSYMSDYVSATGNHMMSEWLSEGDPTCSEEGHEYRYCTVCMMHYENRYPSALGHSYEATEVIDPTENEQGYTVYTCSNCGDSYISDYTDPVVHTHDFIHFVEKIEPTCTEDGRDEYYYCDCGAIANIAMIETTLEELVLPAFGHSYEATEVVDPTETEWGYTVFTCINCGDSYIGDYTDPVGHTHDFIHFVEKIDPTCTEDGRDEYYYCDCGAIANIAMIETTLEELVLPAFGHSYEATEVVDPTETEWGYTVFTCANCGDSYIGDDTNPVGHTHDFIHFVEKIEPTCTEDGRDEYYYCDCGAIANIAMIETTLEELVLPALGHNYEFVNVVYPTCTEEGSTSYICMGCNDTYVGDYTPALGHSYEATEVVEPTETEQGYTVFTCINCGDSYIGDYTDPVGHTHNYIHNVPSVEPTCTEDGMEEYYYCDCGQVVDIAQEVTTLEDLVIPAFGHDYAVFEVVEPTCTSRGWTVYTCMTCGDTYEDDYTPATGHYITEWVTAIPPSCYEAGAEYGHCAYCGYVEYRYMLAYRHEYEAVEIVYPTCKEQGYTVYYCSICGDSYQDDYTKATGFHSWDEGVIQLEPTDTTAGIAIHTCVICGETKSETIPMLGHTHTHVAAETFYPDCDDYGYTRYQCACGHWYNDDFVDPYGHKYGAWETLSESTCAIRGERQRQCSVCGYVDVRKMGLTSHNFVNEQCTECGRYCSTGTTDDGFVYFIDWDDNTVAITDYVGNASDVVIPDTIRDVPVVYIDDYAFYNCGSMVSVHIPETVTYIDDGAFANCARLKEIFIPAAVLYISETAFSGSERLAAINVDTNNGIYSSLNGVLYGGNLSYLLKCPEGWAGEYTLPATVEEIGSHALRVNDYMTAIRVESGSKYYAAKDGVLFDADYTTLVRCPGGWRGEYTVPTSVDNVADYAFYQCEQLVGVTLRKGVLWVGAHAFENSCEMKYVSLPEGLTWIGKYAFADCDRLKTVEIPASVEFIGEYAFLSCNGLSAIKVDDGNEFYSDIAGVLFNKAQTALITYGGGMSGIYKIPAGVESVREYAFYDCMQLTKLVVSAGVTSIGDYAIDNGKACLIVFEGDAPALGVQPFGNHDYNSDGIADGPKVVRYSQHNDTWSELAGKYLNAVVWEAYAPCVTHHTYLEGICFFCGDDCVGICTDEAGHLFVAAVTEPTCTEDGYTTYTCDHCDASYESDYADALGHSWDDGVVTVEPTVEMAGAKVYTCTACGCTEEVSLGKVSNVTSAGDNALNGDVKVDKPEDLTDIVLNDKDKDRLEQGENISIRLEVTDVTDTLDESDRHKTEAILGDKHVGCHLDINLYKQLGEDEEEAVSETNEMVSITIQVPAELISAGRDYVYQMVRVHNGRLSVIDCIFDAESGTVTFETDRFSTYTLVYSEPAITYGDANGDGTVNGKDLLMLRRYMANYDDETKTSTIKVGVGADANGDGEVNGKDLLMLRRYMANYDDETQSSTIVLGPRS